MLRKTALLTFDKHNKYQLWMIFNTNYKYFHNCSKTIVCHSTTLKVLELCFGSNSTKESVVNLTQYTLYCIQTFILYAIWQSSKQGWKFWAARRQCSAEIFRYDTEIFGNPLSFFYFPKRFQLFQKISWKFPKFS